MRLHSGPSDSLIVVRDLDKTYRRGSEVIHVLQGLDLDVDAGDFLAFMGPSGSGKTTLLNLLGGLDVPSAGSITVAGDEITHLSRARLTAWRARHVGFIFQMSTCCRCSRPSATSSCRSCSRGCRRPSGAGECTRRSTWSAWATARSTIPASFPAGSSSAWPARLPVAAALRDL